MPLGCVGARERIDSQSPSFLLRAGEGGGGEHLEALFGRLAYIGRVKQNESVRRSAWLWFQSSHRFQ